MKRILGVFLALVALTVFVSNEFIMDAEGADAKSQMEFMMKAAESGMAEVMMGNLALQKSQNENVRRFAQMMVDEHTTANEELKALAASKNVTLPTDVNSKHKSAMSKLSGMSGADFDKAYMKQQVKDHEAAVKLFQKQANRTDDDADVKAFAVKYLPKMQEHLQMARSLNRGGGSMSSGNMMMNSNNMNSDGNMNSNRNTNSNGNMNSNMNMNSNRNMNSNMNMNSNRNMNSNGNSNRNMNSNSSNMNSNKP